MKSMVKSKGLASVMVFMIGVSYFYSLSLKNNAQVEMVNSEIIYSDNIVETVEI